eukprot:TRINITY_DN3886_c0_g1_i1.p1 TRINITY_DN3886_c0_g1~~TRINITY_DN3886_c0_g1_i1.p1  ORF type:complete len:621 (-),score=108.65 TRINITY_DN3886_c0_g1_i1:36-1898(-)
MSTCASLFLYAIFLPVSCVYSLDRFLKLYRQQQEKKKKKMEEEGIKEFSFLSVGSVALLLQVFAIYWTSALHKSGFDWRATHSATYFALHLSFFKTRLAEIVLNRSPSWLLPLITQSVLLWEEYGSFGFLLAQSMRTITVFGFSLMHIAFGLFMHLDTFIWIGFVTPLALLPSIFWGFVHRLFNKLCRNGESTSVSSSVERLHLHRKHSQGVVMAYNSNVMYQKALVELYAFFFLIYDYSVIDLRSDTSFINDDHETGNRLPHGEGKHRDKMLFIDSKGNYHFGLENALVPMFSASPLLCAPAFLFFKRSVIIRRGTVNGMFVVYGILSWVSKVLFEGQSTPKESRNVINRRRKRVLRTVVGLIAQATLIAIILLTVGCNMISLNVSTSKSERFNVNNLFNNYGGWKMVENLGIDQSWRMFSPNPPHEYFYFVYADAEFDNGTRFQLFHSRGEFRWSNENATIVWEEPEHLSEVFGNHRWFKLYELMVNSYGVLSEKLKLEYGRWICRTVNGGRTNRQQLFHYSLYLMRVAVYNDNYKSDPSKSLFWEHFCYFKNSQGGTREEPQQDDGQEDEYEQVEQEELVQEQEEQEEDLRDEGENYEEEFNASQLIDEKEPLLVEN